MGDLFAPAHLAVILVIVLFIFGPSKLPSIGKDLGKSIREFKKALSENESPATVPATMREPEPEPARPAPRTAAAEPHAPSQDLG